MPCHYSYRVRILTLLKTVLKRCVKKLYKNKWSASKSPFKKSIEWQSPTLSNICRDNRYLAWLHNTTGVNFINVLRSNFMRAHPKSVKRYKWLNSIFLRFWDKKHQGSISPNFLRQAKSRQCTALSKKIAIQFHLFYNCWISQNNCVQICAQFARSVCRSPVIASHQKMLVKLSPAWRFESLSKHTSN